MTKAQLIETVSNVMEIKKSEAQKIIEVVESAIIDGLSDDGEVAFCDSKFKLQEVAAKPEKQGRNPQSGETITISAKPATKKVVFKPGKKLKESFQ